MSRQRWLLALAPLAVGAAALVLLVLLWLYLFVFGSLLGLPVSSLDASGPQWPFATAWTLTLIVLASVPIGVVWAAVTVFLFSRRTPTSAA